MTGPPHGPHAVAWMEVGLRALSDSGLPPDERFSLIGIVAAYALHEASFTRDMAHHRHGRDAAEVEREYGRRLTALVATDPDRFPELSAALATGMFEEAPPTEPTDPDPSFTVGLELMLDGVELLVQRRAAEPDDPAR